jgi:RHS repeat-associated protein
VREVIDPKGFTLLYGYDDTVATYRMSTLDSFGYASAAVWDLRFGTVTETTDLNGNKEQFQVDDLGRPVAVFGPYDVGTHAPTIVLQYSLQPGAPNIAPTWALTRHKDVLHPGDPIDTVSFVDGLGRMIQTKKDLERDDGTGARQVGMAVSGAVTFDARGQVASTGQPTFDTGPATSYVAAPPEHPTSYRHDVLSRLTEVDAPGVGPTRFAYGVEALDGIVRLRKTTTDAQGKVHKVLTSVRDETVAVIERNTIAGARKTLVTRYAYNPLSELVRVIDAKGNTTAAAYDTLGQRVAVDSPDSGRIEYRFDLSGNMAAKETANLRARGELIRYEYTYNRLDAIDYPESEDVTYVYGEPGASDNRAGRIVARTDGSGTEERFYGKLGETVRTVATFVGQTAGQPPTQATTEFTIDSFGRVLSMLYPDGEVLTYGYDRGGLLQKVEGQKAGERYGYIEQLGYNELEQRVRVKYGNGVETRYAYEPETRRLSDLDTNTQHGAKIQRLHYTYDLLGNILGLRNDIPAQRPNAYGGPTEQSFQYDDLDQLVGATGDYRVAPSQRRQYAMQLGYDEIGNIVRKAQSDVSVKPSGQGVVQKPTSYDFAYAYGSSRPHAATHVGDRTYHFDGNGNQTGWHDDRSGQQRTIVWNEEDRPSSIADTGQTTTFLYNAEGQRTHKIGQQGETVYVNQFYTVKNGQIATKHVFAGDSRVASQVAQSSGNGTPEERLLYFYHPDHLGSTSYVTDEDGEVFQHEEYFPFGETWVTEQANTERTPYLFNGKELDEELGLYDFGARYYDPRLSQWLSPDPILAQYLDGAPAGGVYRPINLGLYTYTWNNPLVLVDPTGCWPSLADLKARATRAGDAALGFGYGLAAGGVPLVGNVLGALPPPRTTEAFQQGKGVGQITGGVAQMIAGGTTFGGSVAAGVAGTAATGGGGAPVFVVLSAEGATAGAAMVASGMVAVAQGIQTLQMAATSSSGGSSGGSAAGGGGRGANNLKPDPAAGGAHSTVKRGPDGATSNYGTYEPNPKNPSGFQEVKRVDVTGRPHRNPDGTIVPTPHVKEAGAKGVRPATPEELP